MHWYDIEEIVFNLEENYPDYDISTLTLKDLEELVKSLSDFDDHAVQTSKDVLKEIQEAWIEIRENSEG